MSKSSKLELADRYRDVAEKLIKKYPKAFEHIDLSKVLFLRDVERNPKYFANIRKVNYPYNYFSEYKFIMTIYENKVMPLTVAQQNMVILHELLHIAYDFDKLIRHDVQDFSAIVDKYSSNWTCDPELPDVLADDNVYANDDLGRDDESDENF